MDKAIQKLRSFHLIHTLNHQNDVKSDGTGSENWQFEHIIRHLEMPILLCHTKCGEWPYLFATIVANAKIMLDIADLNYYYFGYILFSECKKKIFFVRLAASLQCNSSEFFNRQGSNPIKN